MRYNALFVVLIRIATMTADLGTPMTVTPGSTGWVVAAQLTARALQDSQPAATRSRVVARASWVPA